MSEVYELSWTLDSHTLRFLWPKEHIEALAEMMLVCEKLMERDGIPSCLAMSRVLDAKFGAGKFPPHHCLIEGQPCVEPSRISCIPEGWPDANELWSDASA